MSPYVQPAGLSGGIRRVVVGLARNGVGLAFQDVEIDLAILELALAPGVKGIQRRRSHGEVGEEQLGAASCDSSSQDISWGDWSRGSAISKWKRVNGRVKSWPARRTQTRTLPSVGPGNLARMISLAGVHDRIEGLHGPGEATGFNGSPPSWIVPGPAALPPRQASRSGPHPACRPLVPRPPSAARSPGPAWPAPRDLRTA